MFSPELISAAQELLTLCHNKKIQLVTAESCTGGLIAALLTDISGASNVFERGFVTYSNEAKMQLLGVEKSLLDACGAVSEQCAIAMAKGAIEKTGVELAVSVTGIAGPSGAKPGKPVGTVCIAVATKGEVVSETNHFNGTRSEVRLTSVTRAIGMLKEAVSNFSVVA